MPSAAPAGSRSRSRAVRRTRPAGSAPNRRSPCSCRAARSISGGSRRAAVAARSTSRAKRARTRCDSRTPSASAAASSSSCASSKTTRSCGGRIAAPPPEPARSARSHMYRAWLTSTTSTSPARALAASLKQRARSRHAGPRQRSGPTASSCQTSAGGRWSSSSRSPVRVVSIHSPRRARPSCSPRSRRPPAVADCARQR